MNEHLPENIQKKWARYEFIGKPFVRPSGRKYMRATYKYWPWKGMTHMYSFDNDFFWHDIAASDLP